MGGIESRHELSEKGDKERRRCRDCALAREVILRLPDAKVLLTSGFPGARLTDMQSLGTSVRLVSKPYRREDLARTAREVLND